MTRATSEVRIEASTRKMRCRRLSISHQQQTSMDFVRAGEALLRSSQPILPLLAPSAYRTTAPRRIAQCLRQQQPSRALSTTPRQRSDTDDFSKLLDDTLDQNKRVPTAPQGRTSRFGSPRAQQNQRTSPSDRLSAERARSSFDDLLGEMRNPTRSTRSTGDEISQMLDVGAAINPNRAPVPAAPQAPPTPPVKLNSTVGRTIDVNENRGMDVGRAFRTLEMRCAQNSVRKDFQRQRYHERNGLKRKRLKSERWRKRFKESFRATIKLVQGLKKQGW